MSQHIILSKPVVACFLVVALASSIRFSQAVAVKDVRDVDMAVADQNEVHNERRTNHLNQLRHFLLTSNAEQRAAKREEQNFYKRLLIREYLRSIDDPDPNHLQELKKRIKTFCNSYEDIMNPDRAACG